MTKNEWKWRSHKGYIWYIVRPLFWVLDWLTGRHKEPSLFLIPTCECCGNEVGSHGDR